MKVSYQSELAITDPEIPFTFGSNGKYMVVIRGQQTICISSTPRSAIAVIGKQVIKMKVGVVVQSILGPVGNCSPGIEIRPVRAIGLIGVRPPPVGTIQISTEFMAQSKAFETNSELPKLSPVKQSLHW